MMGSPQPRTSNWSKRRSIRRLQLASLRRMIVFTRNPSRNTVFEEPVTLSNTGKPEGFHIFQTFLAERADAFACLRASADLFELGLEALGDLAQLLQAFAAAVGLLFHDLVEIGLRDRVHQDAHLFGILAAQADAHERRRGLEIDPEVVLQPI